MIDDITKELAETLRELRTKFDSRENLTWTMVDVDAILDRYDSACNNPIKCPTLNTEEPKMSITKPPFYYNLTLGDKTMYTVAEDEVSKQWATALSGLVDNLGGDKPALWEWEGKTPTPEKVIACLQELFDFHMPIAADNELDECCKWIEDWYGNGSREVTGNLRNARRPQPTLKQQALKDFETVRKNSDLLPEILDTIEKALKSIPDT